MEQINLPLTYIRDYDKIYRHSINRYLCILVYLSDVAEYHFYLDLVNDAAIDIIMRRDGVSKEDAGHYIKELENQYHLTKSTI